MSDDYKHAFIKSVNLIRFSPVLSKDNELIPLNPLPNYHDWKHQIGFERALSNILLLQNQSLANLTSLVLSSKVSYSRVWSIQS